LSWEWLKYLGS